MVDALDGCWRPHGVRGRWPGSIPAPRLRPPDGRKGFPTGHGAVRRRLSRKRSAACGAGGKADDGAGADKRTLLISSNDDPPRYVDPRRAGAACAGRRHRHGGGGLHRPLRPLHGQALRRAILRRESRRARHPCLRLPADRRHGDEPGAGLSLRQLGSAATATSTWCPTWPRCARRAGSTARRSSCATCRTRHACAGAHGAALDPAPAGGARRRRSATRRMAASELEYFSSATRTRCGASKDFAGLEPVGLVHRGLPLLQGAREEPSTAPCAATSQLRACRWRSPRASGAAASTSSTCATPTSLDHGRPPRHLQAVPEGSRRPAGDQRDLHGQGRGRRRPGSSCHIHLSLWRGQRRNAFAGRQEPGPDAHASDASSAGSSGGWLAHVPELMVFYAPTVNSLQALPGGLVGADAHRLEPRQPHRGLPRRRPGPEPAHRVPHPRRRLQSVPRLRRRARLGSRRHRTANRAAGRASTATSTPHSELPRVSGTLREAIDRLAGERFRARGLRARRSSSTTRTSSAPSRRPSTRP